VDALRIIFSVAFVIAVLQTATPLVFAGMGGLLSERSGVMNIALEGFMLVGAFFAVVGVHYTGSTWAGLLCGVVSAAVGSAIHAFWCLHLRGDQIVAGTALNLLGAGVPAFLIVRIWGRAGQTDSVDKLPMIELIPGHGDTSVSVLVPLAFLLVPVVHLLLFSTKPGLRIQASGESPRAAESVGIPVVLYRYGCVIMSGVFAGLGGAYLSIGDLSFFTRDMSAGRGFIALAAVIFGNWMPLGTLIAALLFAAAQAFQIRAQVQDLGIPRDFLLALPYVLTLIAITGLVRSPRPPAGLGQHASATSD
jgi:simple sugar transport system permease protein